jgi:hypothetical protein
MPGVLMGALILMQGRGPNEDRTGPEDPAQVGVYAEHVAGVLMNGVSTGA